MPHRRGSFHENWDELLERFAHRGTPAALEDQLREADTGSGLRRRCAYFLNQSLFERSQPDQREETNSHTEKARSPAAGGS